jgi:hypothetical protein
MEGGQPLRVLSGVISILLPRSPNGTGRAPDTTRIPGQRETTIKQAVNPRPLGENVAAPATGDVPAMRLFAECEPDGVVHAHCGRLGLDR